MDEMFAAYVRLRIHTPQETILTSRADGSAAGKSQSTQTTTTRVHARASTRDSVAVVRSVTRTTTVIG